MTHGYDREEITEAIGGLEKWAKQCHAGSLALVRSGIMPEGSRVARGWHDMINSQHSWAVAGDPYDEDAVIIDVTLWSWTGQPVPGIAIGTMKELGNCKPHGYGSIWDYGCPAPPEDEIITLDYEWSPEAQRFFDLIGYGLDRRGWSVLANAPVGDWPAKEIITAMNADDRINALIPVDIVGMITDENPGELYW